MALGPGGALLDDSLRILAEQLTPPALACVGSMRAARAGNTVVAVWWSPRADSSVRLLSARTTNGGRDWSDVAPVDTTDRSAMGCHHTAPAIAADSASGYVHVTYALLAEEGPGLFFAHSMDGGITFHSPVPIIYGERLGNTSVAASGGHVVVAFEDPNSRTPRIGLALSRTMGHIFEDRMLPVSDDNGSATQPLVAVRGHRVTVAWRDGSTSTRGAVLHVRDGTIH
ncbi:MAG: hypothetical protein JWM95_2266 [Gemmatimonadetes bacterium]|nr:hypothetical protein [Gemmatimonadota bacterium]